MLHGIVPGGHFESLHMSPDPQLSECAGVSGTEMIHSSQHDLHGVFPQLAFFLGVTFPHPKQAW